MNQATEKLEVSRFIKAEPQRVFDAWTDPAMIMKWWGAGGITCPQAEVDLTVGGSYRIANRTPDGHTMWIAGTFTHIDRPSALVYTWAMEPVEPDQPHSIVDVQFERSPGGTTVTINQSRIATVEARDMHLHGWNGCLEGLGTLLTT